MHQSFKGALASPLELWFGVSEDNDVAGVITRIGAPLSLPQREIEGRLTANYNLDGRFTSGRMVLDWPYADGARPVEIALMRETFIRSGPLFNGVGKILRRTSKHTYLAGSIRFDPRSHPSLSRFNRISFISATCYPAADLPSVASAP